MTRRALLAASLPLLLVATAFCEKQPPSQVVKSTGPVCEAIAECGFWQGCANLVPLEPPATSPQRYRVVSGEEKDKVYVRRHSCSAAVGAGETCLEYCSGGASVVCSDGLSAEAPKCDESARPQRATYHCALQPNGDCVKAD